MSDAIQRCLAEPAELQPVTCSPSCMEDASRMLPRKVGRTRTYTLVSMSEHMQYVCY